MKRSQNSFIFTSPHVNSLQWVSVSISVWTSTLPIIWWVRKKGENRDIRTSSSEFHCPDSFYENIFRCRVTSIFEWWLLNGRSRWCIFTCFTFFSLFLIPRDDDWWVTNFHVIEASVTPWVLMKLLVDDDKIVKLIKEICRQQISSIAVSVTLN